MCIKELWYDLAIAIESKLYCPARAYQIHSES